MKLLHLTATHLNPTGGVPKVLKKLVEYQNMIDDVESRVLSINKGVTIDYPHFFCVSTQEEYTHFFKEFKPDVIIIHSFFHLEYVYATKIIKKMGIPYFIEPHGSFGRDAMRKSKIKKWVANNTIFKAVIKNAEGFIFLNSAEKNESVYHKKKELIIPNGIEIKTYPEEDNINRPYYFYFIGRFDIHHKGLDYLTNALDIIDKKGIEVEFRFYGEGSQKETAYLQDKIKLFESVKATVYQPIYGDDKDSTLRRCGVMVLTSRYEGMPMTILEALSYGNPCIITPGTNMQDIVSKNDLGIVCDLNEDSIADSIIRMNELYSKKRTYYIDNCIDYVKQNFLWDNIAKNSIKIISSSLYI